MKIRELRDISAGARPVPVTRTVTDSSPVQSFSRHLDAVNKDNYLAYFSEMTERITQQGIVLGNKPDMYEMQRYRALIGEFMSEAVRFSFEFDRNGVTDHRGNSRVYANIRNIDAHLDRLASAVLAEQKDNLEIVGMIDDIRGLVLDILL